MEAVPPDTLSGSAPAPQAESRHKTPTVSLRDASVALRPDETVLDALLRNGVDVPFSCRGGVCHACLLRCSEGTVPEAAQRGLPEGLQALHYLLACQCRPAGSLRLEAPRARDLRTRCVLTEVQGRGTPFLRLRFEPMRTLSYRPGQTLHLVTGDPAVEPALLLTSDPDEDWSLEAVLHCPDGRVLLPWLDGEPAFGHEFEVWGPAGEAADAAAGAEQAPPEPDPALWHELDDGRTVRRVLEDFYAQVYADPLLQSFFHQVTMERAIGKQYSFLQQLMTGQKVYFGDRPRNAHHWMVITDALFDYRQALMRLTLQAHGLKAAQIERWTRLEEHYRRDMVKSAAWPRVVNGMEMPLQGHASEVLTSGSVCDHCGAEVAAGTEVLYHLRTGHISCPQCAPALKEGADAPGA